MRRTIHTLTLALALLTPGALAQATYLALEPTHTLDAAEQQAAQLDAYQTTVITETSTVPGYESINLQQHTYRVLVGPLGQADLEAARADLSNRGHTTTITTLEAELTPGYQVQVGSYRSDRLAADARAALEDLGEPTYTHSAPPFTFVHAGPYSTRAAAQAALARIQRAGITNLPALGPITPEHQAILDQPTEPLETVVDLRDALAALPISIPVPQSAPDPLPVAERQPEPVAIVEPELAPALDDASAAAEEVVEAPEPQVGERKGPVFVHVASGRTAEQFDTPLASLDELGHAPDVREDNGTYRLYVGPMPAEQADELRFALRQRGIATFITQHASGMIAALPEPQADVVTEVEEEPVEETITSLPAAEEVEAVDAPEFAAASDGEEVASALGAATPAEKQASAPEDAAVAITEPQETEEPLVDAWEPNQPTLADRTELENGTYFTARTGALTEHQADHETLTEAGHPTAFLQASDQTILLVGPLAEWQEDQIRADMRRHGMPAITVHHPHYTPQSTQVAAAAETSATPNNFLALDPLEGVSTHDLTSAAGDLILVNDQLLLGPLPNGELAPAARALSRYATITFYPYPAAPAAGTPEDWAQHAYALLAHQQAEPARQAFLEARALDATHYDALFGLAVTEDQLGNRDAAEFAYQYVMGAHPARFEARFNYALRTHRQSGAAAAIQHYQQALALAADHPDATRAQAHAALADALAANNDPSGAAEHYQAAYGLTNHLDHLVSNFKAQRAAGRALELLPELTRYELETRDARFTALIADIYAQADQAAYALDTIDRRMRDDLTSAQEVLLLNARAATHATAGHHTQALTDLQAAHALDPSDPTTHHNLGLTLLARGDATAALLHLRAAIDHGITDPLALLDVAEAAYRAGDHPAAQQHAHAAAEATTGPARQRALRIHAQAAHATSEYHASIPSLEELLQAAPNDPQLLTLAGAAYYQTGQYARAAERLEAAHVLTGDQNINVALINAYLASQRYGDAERALRATLATTPDDADALHKLGWALLHLGNYQAAQTAWSDATALHHTQASEDLKAVFLQ